MYIPLVLMVESSCGSKSTVHFLGILDSNLGIIKPAQVGPSPLTSLHLHFLIYKMKIILISYLIRLLKLSERVNANKSNDNNYPH